MTGAAGGILASFGLITLVGIHAPNTVKPMAQIMTLVMVATFLPNYLRRSACAVPVGLALGIGSILGAWAGSSFSSYYLRIPPGIWHIGRISCGAGGLVNTQQVCDGWYTFHRPGHEQGSNS